MDSCSTGTHVQKSLNSEILWVAVQSVQKLGLPSSLYHLHSRQLTENIPNRGYQIGDIYVGVYFSDKLFTVKSYAVKQVSTKPK